MLYLYFIFIYILIKIKIVFQRTYIPKCLIYKKHFVHSPALFRTKMQYAAALGIQSPTFYKAASAAAWQPTVVHCTVQVVSNLQTSKSLP